MPKPDDAELLQIDGHQVRISHPAKLYFSQAVQLTKLDLVNYFLAIAPGALTGIQDRPIVLKRFVNGAHAEPFYQKRAPENLPPFLRTVTLSFPSGRTADEVVVDNPAGLAWVMNFGCFELHPHPVRSTDLDHPDQLRIDLDPQPGIDFADVRLVALEVQAVLAEANLCGFPKTSGSRGIHINVPIHASWSFTEVRRAALALARAVERRIPTLATSKWWKEERHGVFLDYNQNAKDRTTASAYSVRPLPDARVSAPLRWAEVPDVDPADFTVLTMPQRFATLGDPHAHIDANPGGLQTLLDLAARDESEGLGDAPWPPHFAKAEGEPSRVRPSAAKKSFSDQIGEGFGKKRFKGRAKSSENQPPETLVTTNNPPGAPSQTVPSSEVGSNNPPGAPSQTVPSSEVGSNNPPGAPSQTVPSSEVGSNNPPGAPSQTVPSSEVGSNNPPGAPSQTVPSSEVGSNNRPGAPSQTVPSSEVGSNNRPGAPSQTVPSSEVGSKPPRKTTKRTPKHPLITVANSPDKAAALAGLDRWKQAHPQAATLLAEDDILIDRMRGSAYIWYRIRLNLRNVPQPQRPEQATPDPDEDPTRDKQTKE